MAVAEMMSVEEYLSTSREFDPEYVDGRLVEQNVGEMDHGRLVGQTAMPLRDRGLHPLISLTTRVKPTRFRVPDVVTLHKRPSDRRFLCEPPYILVEVLSSEDRASEFSGKIEDYIEFGAENIRVIDPRRRHVTVETRDGSRNCRDVVETSDGQISIPLSEIFANMPSTEEE